MALQKGKQKARSGIKNNLIRMSVGIENLVNLIEDIDRVRCVAIRLS
jgi:cystathionine beta-lyase/cystathionine gamma-synthase